MGKVRGSIQLEDQADLVVFLWKIEESLFEGWEEEKWSPEDLSPSGKLNSSGRYICCHLCAKLADGPLAKSVKWSSTQQPPTSSHQHQETISSACGILRMVKMHPVSA